MVLGQGSVQGKAGGIAGFVVEVPTARYVAPAIWPHLASSMLVRWGLSTLLHKLAFQWLRMPKRIWLLEAMSPTASRIPPPLAYSLGVMTEVVIPELFLYNGLSGACITPVAVAVAVAAATLAPKAALS